MSLLRFSYTSRTVSLICLFSPGVHFRTVLEVVTHILSILNCFLSWAFVSCFCYSWHISLCGRDILSLSSGLRRSLKPEKFSRLICWWQPFLNLGMIYLVESKTVRWREPKFVLFSRFPLEFNIRGYCHRISNEGLQHHHWSIFKLQIIHGWYDAT